MLLVVSLVLLGVSEHLVDSLELLVDGAHLNPLFVGLFLLPLFGSFSEGLVAVKAANTNRMDLAMSSTVESSVQLLLFVLPLLVLCGVPMGRYLHLAIPADALFSMGATVLAVHWITENHDLSWYEGALLLTLFRQACRGRLELPPGALSCVYLIAYSSGRFWIEGLRLDPLCLWSQPPFCSGGLRMAQLVSLLCIAAGLFGLWWLYGRRLALPDPAGVPS